MQGAGQGGMCLVTEEVVESVEQQPGYSCHQRLEETCHDSLVTVFSPHQEEDCSEHYEKRCQISFTQEAATETLVTCYRPILKNCSGEGRTECRTEYETSCSATYPAPDSAPAPASCVKLPVSFCGRGCVTAAGEEQCSEKTTDVLREVPGQTHNILNIESILTKSG